MKAKANPLPSLAAATWAVMCAAQDMACAAQASLAQPRSRKMQAAYDAACARHSAARAKLDSARRGVP